MKTVMMYAVAETVIAAVDVAATTLLIWNKNRQRPAKNRNKDTWIRAGITSTTTAILYISAPSNTLPSSSSARTQEKRKEEHNWDRLNHFGER